MHELMVDGAEFAKSMRLLVRTSKRSAASELTLAYEDGELMAELAGAAVAVTADGTWPGVVTVHRGTLNALGKAPTGPLTLTISDDERLRVGGMSFSCRVTPVAQLNLELPLDPTMLQVLRLRCVHTDEELLAAGLLERVQEAERALDGMIESAAIRLKDVGDFIGDIREMVRREVYG